MYKIGDIVYTKKSHACGSHAWKVLRTGAEIKLQCEKCQREILMMKIELDKKVVSKSVETIKK